MKIHCSAELFSFSDALDLFFNLQFILFINDWREFQIDGMIPDSGNCIDLILSEAGKCVGLVPSGIG